MKVLAGALAITTELYLAEEGMKYVFLRLLPMPFYQLKLIQLIYFDCIYLDVTNMSNT